MPTPTFGEKLKRERERRNAAIEEIAGKTKIDVRLLRALEHDEFEALPGRAFGKFYIRLYGEILGFDPASLIADYDREQRLRRRGAAPARPPVPLRRVEAAVARWRAARATGGDETRSAPGAGGHDDAEGAPEETEAPRETLADRPEALVAPAKPPPDGADMRAVGTPAPREARGRGTSTLAVPAMPERGGTETRDAVEAAPREVRGKEGTDRRGEGGGERAAPAPRGLGAATGHDESAAFVSVFGASGADRATGPRSGRRRSALVGVLVALGFLISVAVWLYSAPPGAEDEPAGAVTAPAEESSTPRAGPRGAEDTTAAGPPGATSRESPPAGRAEASEETPPAGSRGASREARRPAPRDRSGAAAATGRPGRLTVPEFGVGLRVIDHRLEGRGRRFEEGSVVWFLTRVLGGSPGEHVRHVWLHEGRTVQSIELELGGPHWRTHSRKTLREAGRWAVEARDEHGHVLARSTFTCVPADP